MSDVPLTRWRKLDWLIWAALVILGGVFAVRGALWTGLLLAWAFPVLRRPSIDHANARLPGDRPPAGGIEDQSHS